MNQVLKYAGLLAIVPLLAVALVPNYIGDAEASGSTAKVHAKLLGVSQLSADSPDKFKAVFDVYAGEQNAINIQLTVSSDRETIQTAAGNLLAGSHAVTTVIIKASDASSISGQIAEWDVNPGSENHLRI